MPKAVLILLAFLMAGINWVIFLKGDRYKRFFDELKEHKELLGLKGTVITIVYISVSFILLLSAAIIKC